MLALLDTATGKVAPLEPRRPGPAVDLPVRPYRFRDVPPGPRPLRRRMGHPAPLPEVERARRAVRVQHHRHRRQDHCSGGRRGQHYGGGGRSLRSALVGAHRSARRGAPRRRPSRHRLCGRHGGADRAPRRRGQSLRRRRRRLFLDRVSRRLRPVGSSGPRRPPVRRPGRSRRGGGQALPARFRRLEAVKARRTGLALAVGPGAPGVAYRVCRDVAGPFG